MAAPTSQPSPKVLSPGDGYVSGREDFNFGGAIHHQILLSVCPQMDN